MDVADLGVEKWCFWAAGKVQIDATEEWFNSDRRESDVEVEVDELSLKQMRYFQRQNIIEG